MHIHRTSLVLSLLALPACMEQGFVSGLDHMAPATPLLPIIRIQPANHDFGSPFVGCRLEQPFRIHNDGDADLVVGELAFAGESDQLGYDDPNRFPLTIPPGEHAEVLVSYVGADTDTDFGQLLARSNDPERPKATADVRGAATSLDPIVETFIQPYQPKSDILVVIDSSGSMDEEQLSLTTNFQIFMDAIVAANSDFHVAIISTDVSRFMGPVITPATADPVGEFARQAALVGVEGSGDEMPMQMVHDAIQPGGDAGPGSVFLRDDAMLAVIVVTDEPDEYSPMTPVTFVDELVAVKNGDPGLVRFHTIGGDVPDPACETASESSVPLDQVVALTGGLFESVCSNWGATMNAVATGSVSLADKFVLAKEPYVPSIVVTVDGVLTTSGWTYDPASQAVVFEAGSMPPTDTLVEIEYTPQGSCD